MATEDEINLIRYLSSEAYPVHEPISLYLSGIGDFEDPSGTEYKFRLLRLPGRMEFENFNGFFGRVDATTHYLYESLPAPGVSAYRILKDLEYTRDRGDTLWDLPDALRPEPMKKEPLPPDTEEDEAILVEERDAPRVERPANLPTANLLGWGPAVKLRNEQRQILETCGIEDGFTGKISRFALNSGLFEVIADRVRVSAEKYKCGTLCERAGGSLAQCLYVEKEPGYDTFGRNNLYCEGTVRAGCAYQLDKRMSIAGIVMAYRMRKEPCSRLQSWACYDFNRYANVPEKWIKNRNFVFDYGQVQNLNAGSKYTAYTAKNQLRTKLMTSGIVKKSSF
jgi:hypothetical protein